jgi:CRP-like cAMP-binding protein
MLAPMGLFQHCSELELRAVAAATVPRRYPSGAELFRAGAHGTELFLLIQGEVDIEGDEGVLVTLPPGTAFGEMALLDSPTRSATARARGEVEALVIPRDAFFQLLRGNPPLAVKILWNMLLRLSANLRRTSGDLAEAQATLARLTDASRPRIDQE